MRHHCQLSVDMCHLVEGAAGLTVLWKSSTWELSRVLWCWGWSCLESCSGGTCSPEPLTWVAAGPSDP